jgi:hypothetical protein
LKKSCIKDFQSGIFVEVNGKYYLNKERLKQIQKQRTKAEVGRDGGSSARRYWRER